MDGAPKLGLGGIWRELSSSFSTLGLQRRVDDEDGTISRPNVTSTPLPKTSILQRDAHIVVGVLLKQVNLTWRPRLFVLQHGVLRYYKVYGPQAVNVYRLLDVLRREGEIYPIGAEVALLEAQDERITAEQQHQQGESQGNGVFGAPSRPVTSSPEPRAEVHMQVASVRESKTDGRKFHVHSGTAAFRLRAETPEDRWVWVEALRGAKGAWDGVTPVAAGAMKIGPEAEVVQEEERFRRRELEAQEALTSMGVHQAAQEYVMRLLQQSNAEYRSLAVAEDNKRRALVEMIYQLENEKRQLETALVVESRAVAAKKGAETGASRGLLAGDASVDTTSENDRDDSMSPKQRCVPQGQATSRSSGNGSEEGGELGGGEESSEEEDEFFECETKSGTHSRKGSHGNSVTDLVALEAAVVAALEGAPSSPAVESLPPLPEQQQQQQQQQQQHSLPGMAVAGGSAAALASTPSSQLALLPTPEWMLGEGPPPTRRLRLPPPQQAEKSVSLWALIKEMVGKDLTRVCLPVYFNEPLSALQKTAEDLEYSHLLDQAALLPRHSVERLLRVAAFAVSAYSSTIDRTAKPFNPLLGETYELVCVERGYRFIAEKVSHHPTIIAACAEGRAWRFEGDADVKSRFWGRSIELKPEGVLRLTFQDGDVYCWNKVCTSINNLVLGKIYVDHGGIMKVRCLTEEAGGLTARVRFKETGVLFDRDPRQVRGYLEKQGIRLERPLMFGHWDDALHVEFDDGRVEELWRKSPPAANPTRYNLTQFAIQLNEITQGLREKLAPTDSRLRPDQAFTEKGMWDEANVEKQRVEHKQRAARRAAEMGEPLRPRWFDILPAGREQVGKGLSRRRQPGELAFSYKGGYWEARSKGDWSGCRDIFGPHVEN